MPQPPTPTPQTYPPQPRPTSPPRSLTVWTNERSEARAERRGKTVDQELRGTRERSERQLLSSGACASAASAGDRVDFRSGTTRITGAHLCGLPGTRTSLHVASRRRGRRRRGPGPNAGSASSPAGAGSAPARRSGLPRESGTAPGLLQGASGDGDSGHRSAHGLHSSPCERGRPGSRNNRWWDHPTRTSKDDRHEHAMNPLNR